MIKLKQLLKERKYSLDHSEVNGKSDFRGPHANQELNLMLNGRKPAAIINDENFNLFINYIKRGIFKYKKIVEVRSKENQHLISIPSEFWRIKQIYKLLNWKNEKVKHDFNLPFGGMATNLEIKKYHLKLGTLLGYSKNDIIKFISQYD